MQPLITRASHKRCHPDSGRPLHFGAGNEFAAKRLFARMKSGAAKGGSRQIRCR